MNSIKKPPIGLEPEWSWRMRTIRKRIIDIISARDRYIEAGIEYPNEWDKEENKLLNELSSWYGQVWK